MSRALHVLYLFNEYCMNCINVQYRQKFHLHSTTAAFYMRALYYIEERKAKSKLQITKAQHL